ncbi:hypothetical protein AAG906_015855 [Vitis piasezkii]
MEAVLPVEIEIGSLRVALERRFETDWILEEVRPAWSGPYFIEELTQRRRMADGFRWKPFDLFHLSPHRHYVHIRHHWVHGSRDLLYLLHFIHEGMGFDHRVFELSFLRFYHPITLAYVTSAGPYREPSSRPALRCLDVVIFPSRDTSLIWPLLTRSARFIFFDIVVIPGWGYLRCLDFPRDRSLTCPSRLPSLAEIYCIRLTTIIPKLFIDMSSRWSVVRDS